MPWPERWQVVRSSWAVMTLGVAVSGGIYTGVFTVAEAAAAAAGLSSLVAGPLLAGFVAVNAQLRRLVFETS